MATRTELLCDVGQHGWLITEVIAQEVGITIMNSAPIVNVKICSKDLINIVHKSFLIHFYIGNNDEVNNF